MNINNFLMNSKIDMSEIQSSKILSFWMRYFIAKLYVPKGDPSNEICDQNHLKMIFNYSNDYLRKIQQDYDKDSTSLMSRKGSNKYDDILNTEPYCLKPSLYGNHAFDKLSNYPISSKTRSKFLINNEDIVQYFGKLIHKILWSRLHIMCKNNTDDISIIAAKNALELLYPKFVKQNKPLSQKTYQRWRKEIDKGETGNDTKRKCKRKVSFRARFIIYNIVKANPNMLRKDLDEKINNEFDEKISLRAIKHHRLIAQRIIAKLKSKPSKPIE